MEIRLLGPLEVHSQGRAIEVAGRRLRLLLAVLALQPGQVVAAERLIDLLWEEASPPADPANALQALVSRLRRALEQASSGRRLASRPSGYLLAVEPDRPRPRRRPRWRRPRRWRRRGRRARRGLAG